MRVKLETLEFLSHGAEEFIRITGQVHQAVEESGIQDGLVAVITAHTTTGIIVNEGLPCVEKDIASILSRIVPLDAEYAHAHFLPDYGATGNNSAGHIKSLFAGNNCMFPVIGGKVVCGSAQDIYLVEFDGPQKRRVFVQILGQ